MLSFPQKTDISVSQKLNGVLRRTCTSSEMILDSEEGSAHQSGNRAPWNRRVRAID